MPQGSLHIGKILGIDIELHWLFILLILFFLYLSPLFGFIWILLFVCVLIHELSHSITAKRNGIKVTKIILLPMGGASIINDLEIDPKIEFRISVAGPLMSFLLGGVFGVLVIFTPPGIITYICQYLFVINILLGVFNILPAFPMDGGRVLRSYLQRKQDFYHATMTTVKVSKYCMALIIIATVVYVVMPSGSPLASRELIMVWDLVIVFFLYEGVKSEEESVTIRQETKGMTIKSALYKNYCVIDRDAKPEELYDLIKRKKAHIILTRTADGDFALLDVFDMKAVSKSGSIISLAVKIPNIKDTSSISDALAKAGETQFRIAAVLRGDKLVGVANGQYISALLAMRMAGKKRGKAFNN